MLIDLLKHDAKGMEMDADKFDLRILLTVPR